MNQTVLVPIADGVEEIEAVCIIDVLRRAGADVTVAAVPAAGGAAEQAAGRAAEDTSPESRQVTASRGVRLVADQQLADCVGRTFDLIALPGGLPGAEHLRDCEDLIALLRDQAEAGRWYGAICAAPAVTLSPHGLLKDKRATCYPGLRERLGAAEISDMSVVVDGNCVTSQGPGTALEFSLMLVEVLFGRQQREETASAMLTK